MRKLLPWLALLFCISAHAQAVNLWGFDGAFHNPQAGTTHVLGYLHAANMASTADQAITLSYAGSAWEPTGIQAMNCSGTLTLAVGGVYSGAGKTGTILIGSTQAYSTLTTSTVILPMTMAGAVATTRFAISTVYFSLSVAGAAGAVCDIYIIGVDLP